MLVTLIHLKKAFDTVDHHILLQKLYVYGMQGKKYLWFLSYIKKCKQCCKVNGHVLYEIKYGFPQRSCLGPLFFLIYIKSPTSININMYADDTIIFSPPTHVTIIQSLLIGNRHKIKVL